MLLKDFISIMEEIAPLELAMENDNIGLLIGTERTEIKKVLVALDATEVTISEATQWGADLLLTHHPIMYKPVRQILPNVHETASAYALIRNGIAHYAAHTNLDAAIGGVNDCLAEAIGLTDISPLPPLNLGRIGFAPKAHSNTLAEFAQHTEKVLNTHVFLTGDLNAPVNKIALVGGAGAFEIENAKLAGADTFIVGELKYHEALKARRLGINILAAGHYETERLVLNPLIYHLQKRINGVQFKLSVNEAPCLVFPCT